MRERLSGNCSRETMKTVPYKTVVFVRTGDHPGHDSQRSSPDGKLHFMHWDSSFGFVPPVGSMTTRPNKKVHGAARLQPPTPGSSLQHKMILLIGALVCLAIHVHPSSLASAADFEPLDPLTETKIGRIERFVATDAFRIGNRIGGRTLSAIGFSFTRHFISVVENDVPAASLRTSALVYTTGDKSLIKALGGEQEAALPFLAYIHHLMELGEGGPSHTDWRSNFAYVRSPVDQRLWAIHWTVNYSNEWNIGAVFVPHADLDWRSGSRLFGNQPVRSKSSCATHADIQPGCVEPGGGADAWAHSLPNAK